MNLPVTHVCYSTQDDFLESNSNQLTPGRIRSPGGVAKLKHEFVQVVPHEAHGSLVQVDFNQKNCIINQRFPESVLCGIPGDQRHTHRGSL